MCLIWEIYNNLQNGIHSTTKYLEMFFSNLFLGTDHELKNRYMYVDYVDEDNSQDKNYIRRENGKRYAKWEILI